MPYIKVMIHFIWCTKNREPLISAVLKPLLLSHIKENSIKKGVFIDTFNCVENHIHLLISLGSEQTISKICMLIKGESSFWTNRQKIIQENFEWQDEYIALSVSKSAIDTVRRYIMNQEEHHKKISLADEYEGFLKLHQFREE